MEFYVGKEPPSRSAIEATRARYRLWKGAEQVSSILLIVSAVAFVAFALKPELLALAFVCMVLSWGFKARCSQLRGCLPSEPRDCIFIASMLNDPRVAEYRRGVVEQGRTFTRGEVEALRRYWGDRDVVAACKEVYLCDALPGEVDAVLAQKVSRG